MIGQTTGTVNGGVSYAEEEAEVTITGVTLNEGDLVALVGWCAQQASSTRYCQLNYTMQIEY